MAIPYYWGKGEIQLTREIVINDDTVIFEYCFYEEFVIIGIRETDELNAKYSDILFSESTANDDGEKKAGWICKKTFCYYGDVIQEEDIDAFIEKIESEVFTGQNSLMSKLTAN